MKKEKLEINLDDMKVTNEAAYFLHQASGWAKFLAITGFILFGLVILIFLIAAITSSNSFDLHTNSMTMYNDAMHFNPATLLPGFAWLFFIMMVVILGIMTIPLFYLYNFADKAKKAIKCNDSAVLAQCFRSLKNLFVFYGIVIIIYFIFFFLSILIGGAASFFM